MLLQQVGKEEVTKIKNVAKTSKPIERVKKEKEKKNNPENKCKTIEKRKIEQIGTIKLDGRQYSYPMDSYGVMKMSELHNTKQNAIISKI